LGYFLLRSSGQLFNGPAPCHFMDWGSGRIHRVVRSTLAAESASASHAADRATYLRALISELLYGYEQNWRTMVSRVPSGFATDCNSLYDLCRKHGSLPSERRIALDLLEVREGLEEFGDQVRWIPTAHMMSDCLTKHMQPDLLMKVLNECVYAFKYDAEIETAKKAARTARAQKRQQSAATSARSVSAHVVSCMSEWYDIHFVNLVCSKITCNESCCSHPSTLPCTPSSALRSASLPLRATMGKGGVRTKGGTYDMEWDMRPEHFPLQDRPSIKAMLMVRGPRRAIFLQRPMEETSREH